MDRIEEWAQHLLRKDIILPKLYNLNSIMRKHGQGTESLASPLQKYEGHEGQEMVQELSRVKKTEEVGQLNGMWDRSSNTVLVLRSIQVRMCLENYVNVWNY